MKKKAWYVSDRDFSMRNSEKQMLPGVNKKIDNQIKCMEKAGFSVLYKRIRESNFYWKNVINPFYSNEYWPQGDKIRAVDVVYIRFIRIDLGFLLYLRNIRKKNKNVKIVLEIPTYPYKGEMKTSIQKAIYFKDRVFSMFLRLYVDRIVLSTPNYKKLFGINVIYSPNGVEDDASSVTINNNSNEIHLIAVASMRFWHGYDRLINGLADYYKNNHEKIVYIHLVGDGPEIEMYKKKVHKFKLQDYIIFEGMKYGEELDEIYNKCCIGVGSLGIHRIDGKLNVSSLKVKEYVSKGFPIIISGYSDMLDEDTRKYILQYKADESPIDISKIVEFYQARIKNNEEIQNEIKYIFRKYYDLELLFKPIVDYFLEA
jgi:hypothetical protein